MTGNRPLRVVYADDEPIARRGLQRLLAAERDVEVVAEASNGTEALEAIRSQKPHLALLDVAMPGLSGLDVVRALDVSLRPAVIFVTAFDRFAIDAFEVHAVDYLLKPFDASRLATALERARERIYSGQSGRMVNLDSLLDTFAQRAPHADRFAVKHGDRITFIATADIDWCEAADNYVRIVAGGRKFLHRETMRSLDLRLAPHGFARIHRATIVNLSRVEELQPLFHGEYQVRMAGGAKLTLSRGYRDAVMARLGAVPPLVR